MDGLNRITIRRGHYAENSSVTGMAISERGRLLGMRVVDCGWVAR